MLDPNSRAFKAKKKRDEKEMQGKVGSGTLTSSILDEEENLRENAKKERGEVDEAEKPPERQNPMGMKRTRQDPNPKKRRKFERRTIIKAVRNRGRINKTQKLLRTERQALSKSPFIKTSIKKLGPLARQIAGKPLTEAMIQMRFSKKRAASDVLKHLQYARNQAVVRQKMGLGLAVPRDEATGYKEGDKVPEERIVVEDKDGKKRTVTDRSAMYIDQAWVGRGPYEFGTDYRARGQAHRLYKPFTSESQLAYLLDCRENQGANKVFQGISILLKEEVTRIRQAKEREKKRQRKEVWVPLPDRPVTAQRQFPLW